MTFGLTSKNNWINYHHLLYFMTIANEGGIAGAAKKLRLGQSTLSTQLGQFEDQLGMDLFERRQRRLHLTEAGRIALQYAREIFKLGDEMGDALHDRRQINRISVQIGALDSIPKNIIVALIAEAQQEQECSISVIEGHADELLRALKAHEIDLLLSSHQPAASERSGVISTMAGRMPVVILGTAKFAPLRQGFPKSLAGQPFVMPGNQSRLRYDVDHFLKLHGIYVDIALEAQDTSLLTMLAAEGAGLIPAGAQAATDLQEKHGLLILGTLQDVFDELWLVSTERRIENPVAARLFRSFKLGDSLV